MTESAKASVFIQWKGTDVCLDFHCFKCNTFGHVDADFTYYLQCPTCGQHYAMPSTVTLKAVERPDSPCVTVAGDPSQDLRELGWESVHPEGIVVSYVGDEQQRHDATAARKS